MKLINSAKKFDLSLDLNFTSNGILARVPTSEVDELGSKFGFDPDNNMINYRIEKRVITSKEELMKLVSDTFDELYGVQ